MSRIVRPWIFYQDEQGHAEAQAQIAAISRSDPAHGRLIIRKIGLLEEMDYEDAYRSRLLKRPTKRIFILKAHARRFASYRLPFFEDPCAKEPTMVFTACVKRSLLDRAGAYSALVEKAEELRLDWIDRHCKGAK